MCFIKCDYNKKKKRCLKLKKIIFIYILKSLGTGALKVRPNKLMDTQ